MKIYNDITEIIGKTPLVAAKKLKEKLNLQAQLLLKLEYFNPAGSIKDRVALQMILSAEENGTLSSGGTIIEPTSGNTGIGIAAIAAARGYKAIIVMPNTMSKERIALIKAYGATVELTDGALGMQGAINRAEEIKNSLKNAIVAGQFTNIANVKAHYNTTAKELWQDTCGKIDIFVAGVGTGGTLTGVATYLKEQNPAVKIVAVEPKDSPVLSKGVAGAHAIQGIGAGFIPKILNVDLIDEVLTVSTEECKNAAKLLAREEGYLVGISSGAALSAAIRLAKLSQNANKNITVILPDTGARYLSTDLFD